MSLKIKTPDPLGIRGASASFDYARLSPVPSKDRRNNRNNNVRSYHLCLNEEVITS